MSRSFTPANIRLEEYIKAYENLVEEVKEAMDYLPESCNAYGILKSAIEDGLNDLYPKGEESE